MARQSCIAILCLVAGLASVGDAQAESLQVGGATRTFSLVTPGSSGRVPLVIALHGQGGTGTTIAASTGWNKLAVANGFAAAFPDAENGSWQVATAVTGSASNPDLAFLNKLVATLVANGTADPRRIYLTGISDGGVMTGAMICGKAQLFAAAAPVIAGAGAGLDQICHPYRPVPMLLMNGTADPIFPYNGGLGSGPTAGMRLMSTPDFVGFWRRIAGCASQSAGETPLPDLDRTDHSTVTLIKSSCPASREVVAYRVNGGGHHQPRRPAPLVPPDPSLGPQNHDIDGAATIWTFFKGHSL